MSPSPTATTAVLAQATPTEPSRLARAWRQARRRPASVVGAVIVLLFVGAAIAAPWIAGADPMQTDWKLIRKAPSPAHPFGTDDLGRDTFARVIYGSRISMQAGVFSMGRITPNSRLPCASVKLRARSGRFSADDGRRK